MTPNRKKKLFNDLEEGKVEIIFEKHERFPEFLFKHFPPARSPPYLEV